MKWLKYVEIWKWLADWVCDLYGFLGQKTHSSCQVWWGRNCGETCCWRCSPCIGGTNMWSCGIQNGADTSHIYIWKTFILTNFFILLKPPTRQDIGYLMIQLYHFGTLWCVRTEYPDNGASILLSSVAMQDMPLIFRTISENSMFILIYTYTMNTYNHLHTCIYIISMHIQYALSAWTILLWHVTDDKGSKFHFVNAPGLTFTRSAESRVLSIWVFPTIGGKPPKWMVYFMENPIKMDDLGVPLFLETPKSCVFVFCFRGW